MKPLILIISHGLFAVAGFVAGIYLLPVLTAAAPASTAAMQAATAQAEYSGELRRDLKGSDFLHWGEGQLAVGRNAIALQGKIAPGPDYRLYLSPQFVEDEAEVLAIKSQMVEVGPITGFENFVVPVPANIDPADYTTALIWCESFGEFISAAQYR